MRESEFGGTCRLRCREAGGRQPFRRDDFRKPTVFLHREPMLGRNVGGVGGVMDDRRRHGTIIGGGKDRVDAGARSSYRSPASMTAIPDATPTS
jgi:hypothetical protein